MSDERNVHAGLRPDAVVKNQWILKSYDQFPVDVVNVSSHDLRYFAALRLSKDFAQRSESQPALKRLVSANTVVESTGLPAFSPFIVRDFATRETASAKSKKVRVAFVGLTEISPDPPIGFKFIDPAVAAKRTLPAAKKEADLVIAVAKMNATEATRVAREAPGIDIIIAGNGVSLEQIFTPPFMVGKTLIVFTPYETRMLGELRFYRNERGEFSTKQRFVTLDELAIPANPAAKELVDTATREEVATQTGSKELLEAWLNSSRPLMNRMAAPGLVGNAVCSQCHVGQYVKWSNGPHARATDVLSARWVEFDASCLDCHATAAKANLRASEFTGLQAVQCEKCHGPGAEHAAKPAKGYGGSSSLITQCATCHNRETSPGFDAQIAWEKIKH